jgi:8-oxo-dGTP pyrophosphatase MutT (NUDIX family)
MMPRPRSGPEPWPSFESLRPAAGLVLLYPHLDAWHLALTLRGAGLRHHTGQVSLPGGRLDDGESVEQAALREAHEEVGVGPGVVEILGRLTPLPVIVSGHLLYPVVGAAVSRPAFVPAAHEVERLIEVPLAHLREPAAIMWDVRERTIPPAGQMDVPYFDLGDARVWGATAMVLAEFLAVVESLQRI